MWKAISEWDNNHLQQTSMFVGSEILQLLQGAGQGLKMSFMKAALDFYVQTAKVLQVKLPLTNEVLR